MKTKILFYSLFVVVFAGSVFLSEMDNNKLSDTATIGTSDSFDELTLRRPSPCEGCYEEEDLEEMSLEAELTYQR